MATTENGVYYQDDYTKIADILADMEKMAESIDELIEKAKYDDTDVKNNIKTIQDEQKVQNDNIEDIQTKDTEQDKLIQKLQSNMINESTEEATSLYVEDASDLPAVLSVRGNHYQETQEGTSNLAVLNEGSITQDGITIDIKDGVATVSGTNTSDAATYITIGTAYLYANNTYYFRKEKGSMGGGYSLFKDGKTIWFPDSGENSSIIPKTGEWTIRYSVGANVSPSGTFKIGIYKTSGAEWVQGKKAIPSLEYPSKIETVKDNIKIIQCNKNFFNVNSKNIGGVDLVLQEDGKYKINGNSTTSWLFRQREEILLKAGDYTLSVETEKGTFNGLFGIRGSNNFKYETKGEVHISLTEDKLITCYFTCSGTATFDDVVVKVQLEKSKVKTEWAKHEEKEYNLSVQQEMLQNDYFNLENNKEIHKWGYINTKNVTNLAVRLNTSNGDFRRYSVNLKINDRKTGEYLKILCTHFKYTDSRWHEYEGICGWESGQTFCIGTFNKELDTAEKMKNYLLNNDVEIYYELAEQEELDLTEEQKQVLNELNNLELFKGTNNIYTEQDLALLQLDYTADTKMYIDSKIKSQNREG